MDERVRLDSKLQPKERANRYRGGNDRISQLPDDIVIAILSLLPLVEATRTSVLSSRWINLWKHTWCLDFDAASALAMISGSAVSVQRRKYVEWVNHILQSHKADTLKEFKVCFYLSKTSSESITWWLEYALARHVEKLDLDLLPKVGYRHTHYAFLEKILAQNSGGASMSKYPSPSHSSYIDFESLKELSLKGVSVTSEAIETLLRICPLLEKLVIHDRKRISTLDICGSSLALTYLELKFFYIVSIKVSAPNLTSLIGPPLENVVLENAPKLVEVSVDGIYFYHSIKNLLPKSSCCISQLEILTLMLRAARDQEFVLSTYPELPKLKKLVISYVVSRDQCLMGLIPWIRSSPNLQEFVLDVRTI